MTTGKTIVLTRQTFVGKVISLLFNMLFRLIIAFLLRSKCPLSSWLQSPSAVIWEPPKHKVCHCFHCFPIICREVVGPDAMILVFWILSFKPAFSLSSFTLVSLTQGIPVVSGTQLPGTQAETKCVLPIGLQLRRSKSVTWSSPPFGMAGYWD